MRFEINEFQRGSYLNINSHFFLPVSQLGEKKECTSPFCKLYKIKVEIQHVLRLYHSAANPCIVTTHLSDRALSAASGTVTRGSFSATVSGRPLGLSADGLGLSSEEQTLTHSCHPI